MNKILLYIPSLLLAATMSQYGSAQSQQSSATVLTENVDAASADSKYEARRSRSNIIIVDYGAQTRAFEPFGGTQTSAAAYAEMVNSYKRAFGDGVTVYCMTIPNAVAFYCPKENLSWTKDERTVLNRLYTSLSDSIVPVEIYDVLDAHKSEPIYSRTDHHWAPLGAYYAAEQFAKKAGVKFMPLLSYETDTVKNYVGSMYTFTKDLAVKNAPEDFVYYKPQNVKYKSWFINYTLGKNRRTIGESAPEERNFFIRHKDGSAGAYCTFMGGDSRTVKVVTENKNGRRLMIMKDSYGNAVPAFLFYAFEEIHVVDFRYFPHSIRQYVSDNGITDVLFANNLIHACAPSTTRKYLEMLAR